MKRVAPALAALLVASAALAQQPTLPTRVLPRAGAPPHEQTAPRAGPKARMSQADRRDLMSKCVMQTQATNPNVAEKNIRGYCDAGIKSITSVR